MVAYLVLRSWSCLIGKQGQVSQCMSLVQAWELVMEGRAGGHPFKCFFFFLILFFWNKSKAHREYNTVCLDLRLGFLFFDLSSTWLSLCRRRFGIPPSWRADGETTSPGKHGSHMVW